MENNKKIIMDTIQKRKEYLQEKTNEYIQENYTFFSSTNELNKKENWDNKIANYMDNFNEENHSDFEFQNIEEYQQEIEELEEKQSDLQDKIDNLEEEKEGVDNLLEELEEIDIFSEKKLIERLWKESKFLKNGFSEKQSYNFEVYLEIGLQDFPFNVKARINDNLLNILKVFPNKKVSNINFVKVENDYELEKITLYLK